MTKTEFMEKLAELLIEAGVTNLDDVENLAHDIGSDVEDFDAFPGFEAE